MRAKKSMGGRYVEECKRICCGFYVSHFFNGQCVNVAAESYDVSIQRS